MSQGKIFNWDGVETRHSSNHSGIAAKVVDGKNMQLIWAEFQPGATYSLHSHEREQFSFMVSGRMRLTVGEEVAEIGPGDMWYAPGDVVHGAKSWGTSPWFLLMSTRRPPRSSNKTGSNRRTPSRRKGLTIEWSRDLYCHPQWETCLQCSRGSMLGC